MASGSGNPWEQSGTGGRDAGGSSTPKSPKPSKPKAEPPPLKGPDGKLLEWKSTPEQDQSSLEDRQHRVYISPGAYLRGMWSLLWTAFRHPLTTTYIDATSGRVLRP